jgi:hypothetical protein
VSQAEQAIVTLTKDLGRCTANGSEAGKRNATRGSTIPDSRRSARQIIRRRLVQGFSRLQRFVINNTCGVCLREGESEPSLQSGGLPGRVSIKVGNIMRSRSNKDSTFVRGITRGTFMDSALHAKR